LFEAVMFSKKKMVQMYYLKRYFPNVISYF
jgi:hypothetical protein